MKFTDKNNFIVKHKSERFFDKDLELFQKHCPNSKLHSDLKRVNTFNRSILVGQMLYELLDKVSPEEILNNRANKPAERVIETVDTLDEVKQILLEQEIDLENTAEEFLLLLIGKTKEEILNILNFGKQVNSSIVVDMKVEEDPAEATETNEETNENISSETAVPEETAAEEEKSPEAKSEPVETEKIAKKKEVNKKSSRK